MYKGTSENMQGRAGRILMRDMPPCPNVTAEEERAACVRRTQQIDLLLASMGKKDPRRHDLGQEKLRLQNRIREIRGKKKGPKNLERHIIDAARDVLPKIYWNMVMDEAVKRHEADGGAAHDRTS